MDKKQDYLSDLTEIRSIIERSTTFISLSGLSGISAGVVGIITYFMASSKLSGKYFIDDSTISYFFTLGTLSLLAAFTLAILFTTRKAKKKNLPLWSSSAKRLIVNLFIPLITGGIFCLLLIHHHLYLFIAPSMLLFYGLALLNAGKYTLHEISFLGISEIILGLIAFYIPEYSLLFWGAGFGLLNIIYGLVMYIKHER